MCLIDVGLLTAMFGLSNQLELKKMELKINYTFLYAIIH